MSKLCENLEEFTYQNNMRLLMYIQQVLNGAYYSKLDIDNKFSQIDLKKYYTKEQVNALIDNLILNGAGGSGLTEEQIRQIIEDAKNEIAQFAMTADDIIDVVNSVDFIIPAIASEKDPTDDEIRTAITLTIQDLTDSLQNPSEEVPSDSP